MLQVLAEPAFQLMGLCAQIKKNVFVSCRTSCSSTFTLCSLAQFKAMPGTCANTNTLIISNLQKTMSYYVDTW